MGIPRHDSAAVRMSSRPACVISIGDPGLCNERRTRICPYLLAPGGKKIAFGAVNTWFTRHLQK